MTTPQTMKERVAQMIERELTRCRSALGEDAWQQHGEWVKDNVVAGAKLWLQQQAAKGAL